MKDIKNGKLVKVGQTVNSTQIKTARILWLERETIKNIKYGKGHNENRCKRIQTISYKSL
jgi:hypothetical protein